MRRVLFLIIPICSILILGCSMPEVQKPSPPVQQPHTQPFQVGEISSDQPIPVGQIIFSAERSLLYYYDKTTGNRWPDRSTLIRSYAYIYHGVDDKNNVKVLYKYEDKDTRTRESFPLLLPLNDKKQTILRVKTILWDPPRALDGPNRDLLITVVDGFNRITVQEVSRTQTK